MKRPTLLHSFQAVWIAPSKFCAHNKNLVKHVFIVPFNFLFICTVLFFVSRGRWITKILLVLSRRTEITGLFDTSLAHWHSTMWHTRIGQMQNHHTFSRYISRVPSHRHSTPSTSRIVWKVFVLWIRSYECSTMSILGAMGFRGENVSGTNESEMLSAHKRW